MASQDSRKKTPISLPTNNYISTPSSSSSKSTPVPTPTSATATAATQFPMPSAHEGIALHNMRPSTSNSYRIPLKMLPLSLQEEEDLTFRQKPRRSSSVFPRDWKERRNSESSPEGQATRRLSMPLRRFSSETQTQATQQRENKTVMVTSLFGETCGCEERPRDRGASIGTVGGGATVRTELGTTRIMMRESERDDYEEENGTFRQNTTLQLAKTRTVDDNQRRRSLAANTEYHYDWQRGERDSTPHVLPHDRYPEALVEVARVTRLQKESRKPSTSRSQYPASSQYEQHRFRKPEPSPATVSVVKSGEERVHIEDLETDRQIYSVHKDSYSNMGSQSRSQAQYPYRRPHAPDNSSERTSLTTVWSAFRTDMMRAISHIMKPPSSEVSSIRPKRRVYDDDLSPEESDIYRFPQWRASRPLRSRSMSLFGTSSTSSEIRRARRGLEVSEMSEDRWRRPRRTWIRPSESAQEIVLLDFTSSDEGTYCYATDKARLVHLCFAPCGSPVGEETAWKIKELTT